VGGVFGAAVGVRNLVRAASRMQKDIEAAEAKDPEGSRWTVDESWLHKDEPTPGDAAPPAKDAPGAGDAPKADDPPKQDDAKPDPHDA